jgi:hypothetical protein
MKVLKNIILCLFMAVSVAGVSTTAFAESDAGRVTYTPKEAIGRVLDRIKIAQDAITGGSKGADVAKLIKDAKDGSKEINSEAIDRLRQNGNGHLAKAIGYAKEDDLKVASEHLIEAAKVFEDMKGKVAK